MLALNLEAAGVKVATIAITPPGKERLPWACTKRHSHAGAKGCKVEDRALREWSAYLGWNWTRLRQAARIATKRRLGFEPPWIMARVWEPQKRGAAHLHLVVPFGTPAERRAAQVFRDELARLAPDYAFGRVQEKLQPITAHDAARYLASYLTGRTRKKNSIRENIADPRLPRALLWLTPKLTRRTLVTMRTLRRARHLWAWGEGICELPRWATLEEAVRIVAVFRTIYPSRAGPAGDDVDDALAYARTIDARVHDYGPLRVAWNSRAGAFEPNTAHFEELTRVAFQVTAGAPVEAPVGELELAAAA